MTLPSLPHLIYIPFMITLGLGVGWFLGSRSVRQEWDRAEARRKKREEEG
ncbi:MAG: hypothetical protein HY791_13945 [Deltaproteobacteria bacterium]|nr:hypothetical protein [Deltaproteobacteria bacterium]